MLADVLARSSSGPNDERTQRRREVAQHGDCAVRVERGHPNAMSFAPPSKGDRGSLVYDFATPDAQGKASSLSSLLISGNFDM